MVGMFGHVTYKLLFIWVISFFGIVLLAAFFFYNVWPKKILYFMKNIIIIKFDMISLFFLWHDLIE